MSVTKITDDNIESLDASKLTGAMPAIDGSALTGISVEQELLALKTNIALNFFLDAVNHARGVQNLSDGFVDQFEDQTGVDDPNSVQAVYNTAGDFYSPFISVAGDATPTMTSLTTPSGTVSSSGGINAYQAFADNGSGGSWDNNPFVVGSWIQFSFNNGLTAKTVIEYSIQGDGDAATRSAKSWTLRASNTGSFSGEEVVLDTQSGIIFGLSEVKAFSFVNATSYIYYRIVFTEHGGNGIMKVGEVELIADGEKNNMTIVSESSTALISPDTAQVTLFKEDVDALTLNTDLIAWASRSKQTITATNATNVLNATAHGLSDNDRVMVTSSGQDLPSGLDSETVYYVVTSTTSTFQVALTSGGSAVTFSDDGTGTHSVLAVTAATLVNQSTIAPYDTVNASVDISAQPSGTNMNLVVQTKNNKDVKIHGQSLQWS